MRLAFNSAPPASASVDALGSWSYLPGTAQALIGADLSAGDALGNAHAVIACNTANR